MNGTWQIFISDTTPTSLGNGVRFHYNPKTNKLQYRDPETAVWIDVPNIDLSPYLTKTEASATYLTQGNASSTYLTITNANQVYLSKTEAASTYLTAESADLIFLTQDDADNLYLTMTQAADVFAPKQFPTFTGTVSLPSTTSIGSVSSIEISYLNGVDESIQDQLERKTEYFIVEANSDTDIVSFTQVLADVSDGPFTVTLPEYPELGDVVYFMDVANRFHVKNLTVSRNGKNIHGKEKDLVLDVNGATAVLMYTSETMGWKVI
jgi:hypothetical protein